MFKNWPVLFIGLAIAVFSVPTLAADETIDELSRLIASSNPPPADLSAETEPPEPDDTLRLTLDKNIIIRLDNDASSVIVNNPEHASVMLDSPRLLIVVPHAPGATSFTVLDVHGTTILKKDVIVSGNINPEYVRIRRMCSGSDASCVPTAYFYCPDGCYEVTPVTPGSGDIPAPASSAMNAAAGLAGSANANNGAAVEPEDQSQ